MWLVIKRDKEKGREVIVIPFDEIVSIWREGNTVQVDSIYMQESFDVEKDKVVVVDNKGDLKMLVKCFLLKDENEFKEALESTMEYIYVRV